MFFFLQRTLHSMLYLCFEYSSVSMTVNRWSCYVKKQTLKNALNKVMYFQWIHISAIDNQKIAFQFLISNKSLVSRSKFIKEINYSLCENALFCGFYFYVSESYIIIFYIKIVFHDIYAYSVDHQTSLSLFSLSCL